VWITQLQMLREVDDLDNQEICNVLNAFANNLGSSSALGSGSRSCSPSSRRGMARSVWPSKRRRRDRRPRRSTQQAARILVRDPTGYDGSIVRNSRWKSVEIIRKEGEAAGRDALSLPREREIADEEGCTIPLAVGRRTGSRDGPFDHRLPDGVRVAGRQESSLSVRLTPLNQ
jgi:hypothetical protein